MKFVLILILIIYNFGNSTERDGDQPKIVVQDGHLVLYSAYYKNISFRTLGNGGVYVNGFDINEAGKISNSAISAMKKYQTSFDESFEKISRFERLLDEGLLQKVTLGQNSTDIPVNSASLVRNVRRLNRRVNNLQKAVRLLTLLLNRDDCASNPCKNGGTCQDLFNDFICRCPPEWEGSLCEKDVNECARFAGTDLGCQNGATCFNKPGAYECVCSHGWFGLHCTRRSTDCKSGSNSELCGHGTCVTQYNDVGYKCICDQGWTTDGKSPACNVDVNECAMDKPPCSVNPLVPCVNLPGSFHCGNCPAGYSGNGYYCSDIDECNTDNGGCSKNPMVQCINTIGSRICGSCPSGYTGDGTTCSYEGVCGVNNGGCHRLATCRSNPRISSTYVECVCPVGYSGSGIGPYGCYIRPTPQQGPCYPNPCVHGSCTVNGTSYSCNCYRRWSGNNCNMFRDLCTSNPCQNGATCTSYLGMSFRCICPSTHTGLRCETQRHDCGGPLNTESGSLSFPSNYQTYSNAMSCAWIIETNITKVLNITFTRFDIEGNINVCPYDWLQIHDGRNTLARSFGRFCGRNLPNGGTIISTHNVVYLWFRSDHSVTSGGFNLTWTSIVPFCGEEVKEVTTHGIIQSPGSPGNYPNNRDCYWPLLAPTGKRLLFHFFTLMIGNSYDCTGDYLEVLRSAYSDPVFSKYCNTSHPPPLFSPASEVVVHFHSDATKTYPGFQITYSVVEGMPGCGGVYTRHQDEIRSPSYSGNYPNDIQCEYKIQIAENSRIKITFLAFSLEESEGCEFDYVAIYAGNTVDSPLIGKYCGSTIPGSYVSESNKLLIVFKTDWANNEGGFTIKYDTVCGGKFTESSGVLQSPGYPNNYANSLECIYEIAQPLGKVVKLQILDLNFEVNSQMSCNYDFLEIRDGYDSNSTLIGTYCNKTPNLIVSSYNYLWLRFVSDLTNNGRGFKANYSTTNLGCGGILKEKSGTFSTPNYPDLYPETADCKWIIVAPPGHVIQILWVNFQVEKSHECTYDFVEIFDNNTESGKSSSIGKFCGQTNPPTLLSTSNLVTLIFKSDPTQSFGGFLATYNIISETNVCGGNYYSSTGFIKTPSYPENYPLNTECVWTIQVQAGHQIMLNVTDFSLEKYSICRYDWLEIRNGGSAVSPLLGKYCGTSIPKLIPSHANKLYLHFHSDMTKSDRGFKIKWEATATGCGGTLNSPTGSIISPNYPEPYNVFTECVWKITISLGSIIQVVFSDLDLEEHTECLLDYVELLDGPTINSKSLGRFCSNRPSFVRSTSNSLTVKFRSDLSRNGRGFQLQYITVCNNTLKGYGGVIESPNFPNVYPSSLNCNWEIEVTNRNKLNISFSHFDLERALTTATVNGTSDDSQQPECSFDYVQILYVNPSSDYDVEPPTFEKYGTYCGSESPPLISLNSNRAKIHFVTDNMLHGNGFRLEWQIEGCGEVLTKPSGTIKSPNYPKPYPPNVECQWKIEVEFGNHIEITFDKIDLEATSICHIDYIKLFNGEDETYPEIATVCHQDKPITLRSSGNFMFIQFKSDVSLQGIGFSANYTTKPTKCGGRFVADKASIMSPNYPQNYEANETCSYQIEVREGHLISLRFEDFDLVAPEGVSCEENNVSYVKIYDGPDNLYPVYRKICGKGAPNETFTSTTNTLYIEMIAYTDTTSKGFLAKYKKSCGAVIVTEGTGTISFNPNDLEYDSSSSNCSWTIISKDPSKHVSLTITHLDTMTSYCDHSSGGGLKIYNGLNSSAPIIGEYCGTKVPPTITSDGSALHIYIEFYSVLFATYSVFDNHCGGVLTSIDGFFASPGYPKQYPMDVECEWTLDVSEGNHVSLSFIDFSLPESDRCNVDYLEIRQNNGTGKLLGTFCGDEMPLNITNMGSLWIFLKTSRVEGDLFGGTTKGFKAEYVLNHENELTGLSGKIISPLYSQTHPFYGDYSWRITVNPQKRILLSFKELNLENNGYGSGEDSCFSEISVYDGTDASALSIGTYCGPNLPDDIKSTSNIMFIKFSGYPNSRSVSRFILEWSEIEVKVTDIKPKGKGCGTNTTFNAKDFKNVTNPMVKIFSPGYPNGYANDLRCEWIVTTSPMNHLSIYFYDFDLQPMYGGNCWADYVEVFEKRPNSDWTSVVKACHENVTNRGNILTTNMMKVVFVTDRNGNRTGFMSFVREVCGGELTDPSGVVFFDNSTLSFSNSLRTRKCQWNITVGAGKTIKIEFENFDIIVDKDSGCNNYLLMRNGKFEDSPILGDGKYCGQQKPPTLQTTGNNAYISIVGNLYLINFKLRYSEVSYECGGEIILNQFDNSTEISSPNYPQIPPAHIECLWRIIAPAGEIIRIDFPYRFDIATGINCPNEYVEVRDGGTVYSKLIGKFCGKKPNPQFSTDNMMFIKFFTQLNDPSNGFKARITLDTCGGTVYGTSGQIQSPFFNKLNQYPVGANCTWHLKAPSDHTIDLTFSKLDLENGTNCSAVDHVSLYEPARFDPIHNLGTFCGKTLPDKLRSFGNEVVVNFQSSKEKKELAGFSLKFNSSTEVCGGAIEATEGFIQSPYYPSSHKSHKRCTWYITVPRGRRITLDVLDYDLNGRLEQTWIAGIAIYNEEGFKAFLKKLTSKTTKIETPENHVVIYYWNNGNSGRGFKLKFSSNEPTKCVGDLNQSSGTIVQPNLDTPFYCTYYRDNLSVTTLSMSITTKTNRPSTNGARCFAYVGEVRIETTTPRKLIKSIGCHPTSTLVRIPFPHLKMTVSQTSQPTRLNYTIHYNTYPCGGTVSGETGNVASPSYPNKHPQSMECVWLIKIPKEQSIVLTFDDLDLGDDCEQNYLDIYNGDSPSSPKIDRLCQSTKPEQIISQSNSLWIEYKYDRDSGRKGFSLKYEPKIRGCGGIFHDSQRIIETPQFPGDYPNNAECLWELRSDIGYHIGLTFGTRFQIEESDNCENDFVEIWDWKNDDWYSLGKKCGRELPKTVNSTSNKLKIMFRSNDRIPGKGFRATWNWNCGGNFIADKTERFIMSPGYPNPYEKNLDCWYNITSKVPNEYINIKFIDFDLEGTGSNCKFDNVSIESIYSNTYRRLPIFKQVFCGQKMPPYVRQNTLLSIRFMTDAWIQKSGFKFSYQLDDCGGNITKPTIIRSPNMSGDRSLGLYTGYMTCLWNITVPPKKTAVIDFQEFRFEYRRNCYFDNVEIFQGPSTLRMYRIANLCGDLSKNLPVFKVENSTVLINLRTDRTNTLSNFKAAIYFTDGPAAGCGGKIQLQSTETITAPDLSDMDCSWTIQSEVGTNIKLHFEELNLPGNCGSKMHPQKNCSCAFLDIKDGHPSIGETIERFCGIASTNIAREVESTQNVIGIRLKTLGSVNRAFKLTLSPKPSPCGTIKLNVTEKVQTLTSPGYPNISSDSSVRCAWMIIGNSPYTIHFVDFDLNEDTNETIINNVCNDDKLEILETPNMNVMTNELNSYLTLSGNKKKKGEFHRYVQLSGTHQFCGKSLKPFDYYTNYATIVVKFSSGNSGRRKGRGFKFEYFNSGCNRNYTAPFDRIVTRATKECFQTITVQENYTISLFFENLAFYNSPNCEHSGIEIRDGKDDKAPLLSKVCSYGLPNPVFSTKNQIWIHLWQKTQYSIHGNYEASYTSTDKGRGCGGTFFNWKGSFTSPLYPLSYKNSTACIWDVRVPIGMRAGLKFNIFDIRGSCELNYVEVTTFEKEDQNVHKFCANDTPGEVYSNSQMQVKYQSSLNNDGTGWSAIYEAVSGS